MIWWFNNSWTRGFELVTRGFELVARVFELVTRGFEFQHGMEFRFGISTCAFKLSTRNS